MRSREIISEKRSALDGNLNSLGRPISGDPSAFWAWFGKSKVKDKEGRPLVVFHGTDSDFSKFDPSFSNSNSNTGVPRGAFVFSDHSGVASSYSAAGFHTHGWRDPKITDAFRELMKTGSFDDQMEFLERHPAGYDDYKDGGNVMPVYLKMVKPLIVNAKGENWNRVYFQMDGEAPEEFTTNEIAQVAMEKGYDGCIIRNVTDVSKGPRHISTTFFVFSPNQIKSAIGNKGTFAKDSDEIHEDVLNEDVGTLNGWWIDETGTIHECDHRNDLHHADIAMNEFEIEDEDEDGEGDDDYLRDHAIQTALDAGWVRGSTYDRTVSVHWEQPMSKAARTAVLRWLETYGPAYEEFLIQAPRSDFVSFSDAKQATRYIYNFSKSNVTESVLTEGLIAIPPKMHEHIDFLFTYNLLWKVRDAFRGKVRELPEQYAAFKKEVAALGEEIPKERYPTDKNVFVWSIPVNLTGMPSNYEGLTPRKQNILFAIDWRPTKAAGGWHMDKDALILYPMSIDFLARFPSQRSHPDDLKIAIQSLRETISHELRHMVQMVILHDHPEQARQRPGYEKHGDDYFASPIEFDPMIGSAVQEFLELWTEYGKPGGFSKAVKQFTAMAPSGTFDTFNANRLFKALKKVAPKKHQIAASKFVRELKGRL